MTEEKAFALLVEHYEDTLNQHGVGPNGADWPNAVDLEARFDVLLSPLALQTRRVSLLDLGCGAGLLVDYLAATGRLKKVDYTGIDLSQKIIDVARQHHAHRRNDLSFERRDVLSNPLPEKCFDHIVMNGVLTERLDLSFDEMWSVSRKLISTIFQATRCSLSFNLMSTHVDWDRDDLFHVPIDLIMEFLTRHVSRHVTIRSDYGLYEYSILVHREPVRPPPIDQPWWSG